MGLGNITRVEAQARSALIDTRTYDIAIDLTGIGLDEPAHFFRSRSTISFVARGAGSLHVDALARELTHASLDDAELDTSPFRGERLQLDVGPGEHSLVVDGVFRYSHSGEGLHRFVDPADDRVYLYTQFEVSEARRVFACFEQPDLKATFRMRVDAPSQWTVVSNGPQETRLPLGNGFDQWQFSETLPVSTYLTALVAGEYHTVGGLAVGRGAVVPTSILCRQSMASWVDHDSIFAVTADGFAVFEREFRLDYPFGKYDQVFVPEFNGGAMENIGCVTMRDEYLFRSRVTRASLDFRNSTILHELSHMWFGNLVTMRWWDDLWLKESFATWASHFALSRSSADPVRTWAVFANGSKNWAYREDQLPSTHPIAADLVDLEAVELNFDDITYAKGASVLVQLVAFVGQEKFLEGVRGYFSEHAFGNTTLADLLRALSEASGRDLRRWSAEWLETSGVNTLRPKLVVDGSSTITSFAVQQTAAKEFPTLRSHRIAIGCYRWVDGALIRTQRVETDIEGPETAIGEFVGTTQPDMVLLNDDDDDLTYAKVRLDRRSLASLTAGIHTLDSPLTRAVCWGAAWDMCRDAELFASDYVDLVLRGVAAETDLTAVRTVLLNGVKAARDYTAILHHDEVLGRLSHGLWRLLGAAAPGSDHQVSLARACPATVEADQAHILAGWLSDRDIPDGLVMDREMRWLVVTHLSRLGKLDDAAIDAEAERDATITGAESAAGARAAQPTAAAKERAWTDAVDADELPNGTQSVICKQFLQPGQDEVLEPYVERYLRTVEEIAANRGIWATKSMSMRNTVLSSLFPRPRGLADFVSRLDDRLSAVSLPGPVRRIINDRRDDALRSLRCQQADQR